MCKPFNLNIIKHSEIDFSASSCYFILKKSCITKQLNLLVSLYFVYFRTFYSAKSSCKHKLLIIQCESANKNVELLDSVRYIIHRETADLENTCHTMLLLSLARGQPFSGYQGRILNQHLILCNKSYVPFIFAILNNYFVIYSV